MIKKELKRFRQESDNLETIWILLVWNGKWPIMWGASEYEFNSYPKEEENSLIKNGYKFFEKQEIILACISTMSVCRLI